jgi:NADH-quinone oxidoreductase subunit C
VTEKFSTVQTGSALREVSAPVTARSVPHKGGQANPTVAALESKFAGAVVRSQVVWGETTVYIQPSTVTEIMQWLHDDPDQKYDYLSDVTAVEYRDYEEPLEVVWHLRSLPFRRFLRVKAQIPRGAPLSIPSVWGIWKGADWMERECYDMFGIVFEGHPDLRRILMWEQYREGFPLRKDFPLRGRFSRAEQLRQALAQNIESRYSMEELSIADAFEDLPPDMRQRLSSGVRTGE